MTNSRPPSDTETNGHSGPTSMPPWNVAVIVWLLVRGMGVAN